MIEETQPPETEDEEVAVTSRRLDTELRILSAMIRQLDALDDEACARVVAYLASRYARR